VTHSPSDHQQPEARVKRVLTEGLERVQTPEMAREVLARAERMAAGHTEADLAEVAAEETSPARNEPLAAARSIEQAAERSAPEASVADVLSRAAEQAVAPTPAAPAVVQGAQAAFTPSQPVSPEAERGRRLLEEEVLRRMPPLQSLDARLYLAVNDVRHPGWMDSLAWAIAIVFMGGWVWVVGTLLAYLLRVPRSWHAVKVLLPCVTIATWIIEFPVKAFFRRRRPFVEIVRALVIGKKPGSWSFPSGHTASSFASAWALSTVWPKASPVFFTVAALVGASRVYVGAHYPGDVASGAVTGVIFSEIVRRAALRLFG
jgi:membrane-associated phospholipid phosphatase